MSIVVTAANTHDKTIALETLDGIVVERPEKRVYRLHHSSLDKGYDDDDGVAGVLKRDFILYAGGSSNAPTPGTTGLHSPYLPSINAVHMTWLYT